MSISVRPATAKDVTAIGQLTNQFVQYLRDLGDTSDLNMTTEVILRDGFGEQPAFSGLVAEQNNVVVGYLFYHFGYDVDNAARNLHVLDLYMDQNFRGQGIGKALMKTAAKLCREVGGTELFWAVYNKNKLAMSFYEAIGARYTKDLLFMKIDAHTL